MASLPYSLIVLLIILGAGAVAILGMGVHRLFSNSFNGPGQPQPSEEQAQYMRDVRAANINTIYREYRMAGYKGPNPNNPNNHGRESDSMI